MGDRIDRKALQAWSVSIACLAATIYLLVDHMNWSHLPSWPNLLGLSVIAVYLYNQNVAYWSASGSITTSFSGLATLAACALFGMETGVLVNAVGNLTNRFLLSSRWRKPDNFPVAVQSTILSLFRTAAMAIVLEALFRFPTPTGTLDWLRLSATGIIYTILDAATFLLIIPLVSGQFKQPFRIIQRTFLPTVVVYALATPPMTWLGRGHGLLGLGTFFALVTGALFALKAVFQVQSERLSKERAEEARLRDGLTGVYNKIWLTETTHTWVSSGRHFTMALVDIDNFKQVNDQCGHIFGDMVLKDVADTLQLNLRGGMHLARFGGEEFVILMPLSGHGGPDFMEELARTVAEQVTEYDGIRRSVSLSGGFAVYPTDGTSFNELFQVADAGLYLAKANGRMQICYAGKDSKFITFAPASGS